MTIYKNNAALLLISAAIINSSHIFSFTVAFKLKPLFFFFQNLQSLQTLWNDAVQTLRLSEQYYEDMALTVICVIHI